MKLLPLALATLAVSLAPLLARADVVKVGPSGETSLYASGDVIASCATLHCYIYTRAAGAWSGSEAEIGTSIRSAAFDGDLLAVGIGADKTAGSVQIYRRGSTGAWSLQGTVSSSESAAGDSFGADVAVANGRVFVGAPSNTTPATAGAVFVFEYADATWTQVAKLQQAIPQPDDSFGRTVRASGDLVVGQSYTETASFTRTADTWTSAGVIEGTGSHVSLSGDVYAVVDLGRLYVYRRGTAGWKREHEQDLLNPAGKGEVRCQVSVNGDRLAVGCVAMTDYHATNARVEILGYTGGAWKRRAILDPETLDPKIAPPGLGYFVAVGPDYIAAAALMGAEEGSIADQLYVFTNPASPSTEGAACKNGLDCGSGNCVEGVCCESLCSGACESCRASATGAKDGACAPVGRDAPSKTGACDPYVCRDAGCLNTCSKSEDCHSGFLCAGSECVKAATCRDDRTLVSVDGRETNCAPYRCQETGCPKGCAATTDCLDGAVCDVSTKQCVAASPSEDDGGCSMRAPSRAPVESVILALLGVCAGIARLRRRR